ncbi:phenylacetate--CoA ligase family protein [Halobacteriovorax marinus]|uniref:phenylacetate--CoA ligase family protein n=1 Tax=Halobacteriovorax marinus TaxID=97084 RepID=UPI003A8D424F
MKQKLREHIDFVRENSPFYKELYRDVPLKDYSISDLPILNQDDYWSKNGFENNSVLTSDLSDGVVFKSGGTTGVPKSSFFTQEEWETFTTDFSFGMDQLRLQKGDRCANLFYSGDLYASFLFINKSVEKLKNKVVQFPVTGQTSIEETKRIINSYKINVLFGVPTSLVSLAASFESTDNCINQIYYGGEPLFDDQREKLQRAFPEAHISSIGYASVDGGQLGYVDKSCAAGEHIVFDKTYMEIVDPDTNEVILEENKVGRLIYTNLSRRLMPIVRYPVGDMASWTEVGKRFSLLGRADEGARIGAVTVTRADIVNTAASMGEKQAISGVQLLIKRENGKDYLHVYLGVQSKDNLNILNYVHLFKESFFMQRPMYKKEKDIGNIADLKVSIVLVDELLKNPRTGKLRLVIDERFI